jgi:polyketide synthase PksN
VALRRGLLAIRSGESAMAIVGGVNSIVSPSGHITFSKAGMLSQDGRCKTFSAQANGYVRGEGVGILVLKKLSAAERDGDHVYGLIRGSAENHGGRASSLTAPNPKAQAALLVSAYREAGIDPRSIGYIEAHGTGTPLGDPVEINGLKSAFKELYQAAGAGAAELPHCGLGSVKSNIGHLELAAGVAGVIKVLLQLKHKTLVKSLHSETVNPHIDLDGSPFYVVRDNQPWEALRDAQGRELPRRAGVSSFGFGGVNAHVVIEEYVPTATTPVPAAPAEQPVLIVLSAKNPEGLRAQVARLLEWADTHAADADDLADAAYTLQVGREPMEERLALIVDSVGALRDKLTQYLAGEAAIDDLYVGQAKRNKDAIGMLTLDEDMSKTIDAWIAKGKYGKLLDFWCRGLSLDWNKFHGGARRRRVSLPTYPFARKRYWVPQANPAPAPSTAVEAALHPLLHRNTSSLAEQRFSSTFYGTEFFLADHVVQGRKILPGVAHLEMAREALRQATGIDDASNMSLEQVVWSRPVLVPDDATTVHIGLSTQEDGTVRYDIYGTTAQGNVEPYSQGTGRAVNAAPAPAYQLDALLADCTEVWESARCYELFAEVEVNFGPRFRALQSLHLGAGQAVGRLVLPAGTDGNYVLHPSMLDGALHSAVGLLAGGDRTRTHVPFALDRLTVYGPCGPQMWAVARIGAGGTDADRATKLDIDVCDPSGRVCVRLSGLSTRAMAAATHPQAAPVPCEPELRNVTLIPVWDPAPAERARLTPAHGEQVVLIGGTPARRRDFRDRFPQAVVLELPELATSEAIADALANCGAIDHLFWIAPDSGGASLEGEAFIEAQRNGVMACLRLVKSVLALGYGNRALAWTIITCRTQMVRPDDVVEPAHASVHGLAGSMAKEYGNWAVRVLDLEEAEVWPLGELLGLPADAQGRAWAYRAGVWHQQRLLQGELAPGGRSLYRRGGVYVVIGGAGGIGEAWSEHMLRTQDAQLVWIGRRAEDAGIAAKRARLAEFGPEPLYLSADARDRTALELACREIMQRFGRIDGLVHAAIDLLDMSLEHMDEERFAAGLAAKVDVSVRMAQVFGQEPMDFVLFLSSVQSFVKTGGQSNYAAGCVFKDAFAQYLRRSWRCPVKVMNWGYWGSVGTVAAPAYRERMARLGIGSIEPEQGMSALATLLAGPLDQFGYICKTTAHSVFGEEDAEVVIAYEQKAPSLIKDLEMEIALNSY